MADDRYKKILGKVADQDLRTKVQESVAADDEASHKERDEELSYRGRNLFIIGSIIGAAGVVKDSRNFPAVVRNFINRHNIASHIQARGIGSTLVTIAQDLGLNPGSAMLTSDIEQAVKGLIEVGADVTETVQLSRVEAISRDLNLLETRLSELPEAIFQATNELMSSDFARSKIIKNKRYISRTIGGKVYRIYLDDTFISYLEESTRKAKDPSLLNRFISRLSPTLSNKAVQEEITNILLDRGQGFSHMLYANDLTSMYKGDKDSVFKAFKLADVYEVKTGTSTVLKDMASAVQKELNEKDIIDTNTVLRKPRVMFLGSPAERYSTSIEKLIQGITSALEREDVGNTVIEIGREIHPDATDYLTITVKSNDLSATFQLDVGSKTRIGGASYDFINASQNSTSNTIDINLMTLKKDIQKAVQVIMNSALDNGTKQMYLNGLSRKRMSGYMMDHSMRGLIQSRSLHTNPLFKHLIDYSKASLFERQRLESIPKILRVLNETHTYLADDPEGTRHYLDKLLPLDIEKTISGKMPNDQIYEVAFQVKENGRSVTKLVRIRKNIRDNPEALQKFAKDSKCNATWSEVSNHLYTDHSNVSTARKLKGKVDIQVVETVAEAMSIIQRYSAQDGVEKTILTSNANFDVIQLMLASSSAGNLRNRQAEVLNLGILSNSSMLYGTQDDIMSVLMSESKFNDLFESGIKRHWSAADVHAMNETLGDVLEHPGLRSMYKIFGQVLDDVIHKRVSMGDIYGKGFETLIRQNRIIAPVYLKNVVSHFDHFKFTAEHALNLGKTKAAPGLVKESIQEALNAAGGFKSSIGNFFSVLEANMGVRFDATGKMISTGQLMLKPEQISSLERLYAYLSVSANTAPKELTNIVDEISDVVSKSGKMGKNVWNKTKDELINKINKLNDASKILAEVSDLGVLPMHYFYMSSPEQLKEGQLYTEGMNRSFWAGTDIIFNWSKQPYQLAVGGMAAAKWAAFKYQGKSYSMNMKPLLFPNLDPATQKVDLETYAKQYLLREVNYTFNPYASLSEGGALTSIQALSREGTVVEKNIRLPLSSTTGGNQVYAGVSDRLNEFAELYNKYVKTFAGDIGKEDITKKLFDEQMDLIQKALAEASKSGKAISMDEFVDCLNKVAAKEKKEILAELILKPRDKLGSLVKATENKHSLYIISGLDTYQKGSEVSIKGHLINLAAFSGASTNVSGTTGSKLNPTIGDAIKGMSGYETDLIVSGNFKVKNKSYFFTGAINRVISSFENIYSTLETNLKNNLISGPDGIKSLNAADNVRQVLTSEINALIDRTVTGQSMPGLNNVQKEQIKGILKKYFVFQHLDSKISGSSYAMRIAPQVGTDEASWALQQFYDSLDSERGRADINRMIHDMATKLDGISTKTGARFKVSDLIKGTQLADMFTAYGWNLDTQGQYKSILKHLKNKVVNLNDMTEIYAKAGSVLEDLRKQVNEGFKKMYGGFGGEDEKDWHLKLINVVQESIDKAQKNKKIGTRSDFLKAISGKDINEALKKLGDKSSLVGWLAFENELAFGWRLLEDITQRNIYPESMYTVRHDIRLSERHILPLRIGAWGSGGEGFYQQMLSDIVAAKSSPSTVQAIRDKEIIMSLATEASDIFTTTGPAVKTHTIQDPLKVVNLIRENQIRMAEHMAEGEGKTVKVFMELINKENLIGDLKNLANTGKEGNARLAQEALELIKRFEGLNYIDIKGEYGLKLQKVLTTLSKDMGGEQWLSKVTKMRAGLSASIIGDKLIEGMTGEESLSNLNILEQIFGENLFKAEVGEGTELIASKGKRLPVIRALLNSILAKGVGTTELSALPEGERAYLTGYVGSILRFLGTQSPEFEETQSNEVYQKAREEAFTLLNRKGGLSNLMGSMYSGIQGMLKASSPKFGAELGMFELGLGKEEVGSLMREVIAGIGVGLKRGGTEHVGIEKALTIENEALKKFLGESFESVAGKNIFEEISKGKWTFKREALESIFGEFGGDKGQFVDLFTEVFEKGVSKAEAGIGKSTKNARLYSILGMFRREPTDQPLSFTPGRMVALSEKRGKQAGILINPLFAWLIGGDFDSDIGFTMIPKDPKTYVAINKTLSDMSHTLFGQKLLTLGKSLQEGLDILSQFGGNINQYFEKAYAAGGEEWQTAQKMYANLETIIPKVQQGESIYTSKLPTSGNIAETQSVDIMQEYTEEQRGKILSGLSKLQGGISVAGEEILKPWDTALVKGGMTAKGFTQFMEDVIEKHASGSAAAKSKALAGIADTASRAISNMLEMTTLNKDFISWVSGLDPTVLEGVDKLYNLKDKGVRNLVANKQLSAAVENLTAQAAEYKLGITIDIPKHIYKQGGGALGLLTNIYSNLGKAGINEENFGIIDNLFKDMYNSISNMEKVSTAQNSDLHQRIIAARNYFENLIPAGEAGTAPYSRLMRGLGIAPGTEEAKAHREVLQKFIATSDTTYQTMHTTTKTILSFFEGIERETPLAEGEDLVDKIKKMSAIMESIDSGKVKPLATVNEMAAIVHLSVKYARDNGLGKSIKAIMGHLTKEAAYVYGKDTAKDFLRSMPSSIRYIDEQIGGIMSKELAQVTKKRSLISVAADSIDNIMGAGHSGKLAAVLGIGAAALGIVDLLTPDQTEDLFGIAPESGELYDYSNRVRPKLWSNYKANRATFRSFEFRDNDRPWVNPNTQEYLPNNYIQPSIYRRKGSISSNGQEEYQIKKILGA